MWIVVWKCRLCWIYHEDRETRGNDSCWWTDLIELKKATSWVIIINDSWILVLNESTDLTIDLHLIPLVFHLFSIVLLDSCACLPVHHDNCCCVPQNILFYQQQWAAIEISLSCQLIWYHPRGLTRRWYARKGRIIEVGQHPRKFLGS